MKQRFRIPIAFKLIFITVGLLLAVSWGIATQSTHRFEQISTDREEQAARDQSRARATEVEGLLLSYIDKVRVIAEVLQRAQGEQRSRELDLIFKHDKDIVAVEVIGKSADSPKNREVNEEYLKQYKQDASFMDVLR